MIIFSTVWSICWRISGLICEFGILSLIQQRLCIKNWGHFYQTMMTLITATRGSFSAEVWDPRTFFPTVRFGHNLTGQLYTIHFLGCFYYKFWRITLFERLCTTTHLCWWLSWTGRWQCGRGWRSSPCTPSCLQIQVALLHLHQRCLDLDIEADYMSSTVNTQWFGNVFLDRNSLDNRTDFSNNYLHINETYVLSTGHIISTLFKINKHRKQAEKLEYPNVSQQKQKVH